MIEIPAGTRVYGIQLPIQSKSKTFVADWEMTATPADLARVAQTADEVLILDRGCLVAHRAVSDIASLEDTFLELTDRSELPA